MRSSCVIAETIIIPLASGTLGRCPKEPEAPHTGGAAASVSTMRQSTRAIPGSRQMSHYMGSIILIEFADRDEAVLQGSPVVWRLSRQVDGCPLRDARTSKHFHL